MKKEFIERDDNFLVNLGVTNEILPILVILNSAQQEGQIIKWQSIQFDINPRSHYEVRVQLYMYLLIHA